MYQVYTAVMKHSEKVVSDAKPNKRDKAIYSMKGSKQINSRLQNLYQTSDFVLLNYLFAYICRSEVYVRLESVRI